CCVADVLGLAAKAQSHQQRLGDLVLGDLTDSRRRVARSAKASQQRVQELAPSGAEGYDLAYPRAAPIQDVGLDALVRGNRNAIDLTAPADERCERAFPWPREGCVQRAALDELFDGGGGDKLGRSRRRHRPGRRDKVAVAPLLGESAAL